jgi:hypothetical protein
MLQVWALIGILFTAVVATSIRFVLTALTVIVNDLLGFVSSTQPTRSAIALDFLKAGAVI